MVNKFDKYSNWLKAIRFIIIIVIILSLLSYIIISYQRAFHKLKTFQGYNDFMTEVASARNSARNSIGNRFSYHIIIIVIIAI